MEPFDGLDLRFSKRWKGLRERYFIRRGLNWYGDNTNQRKYNDRNWICQAVAFSLLGVFPMVGVITNQTFHQQLLPKRHFRHTLHHLSRCSRVRELLHNLTHIFKLLDQLVHFGNIGTRTFGNPGTAILID